MSVEPVPSTCAGVERVICGEAETVDQRRVAGAVLEAGRLHEERYPPRHAVSVELEVGRCEDDVLVRLLARYAWVLVLIHAAESLQWDLVDSQASLLDQLPGPGVKAAAGVREDHWDRAFAQGLGELIITRAREGWPVAHVGEAHVECDHLRSVLFEGPERVGIYAAWERVLTQCFHALVVDAYDHDLLVRLPVAVEAILGVDRDSDQAAAEVRVAS